MSQNDSPFHRAKESDADRQIQFVKTRFVEELTALLALRPEFRSAKISHPMMSRYITIDIVMRRIHAIKLHYDMDTHAFKEPPHITFANTSFVTNGIDPQLRDPIKHVLFDCFTVSKMVGLGSKFGGNWVLSDSAEELAQCEMTRLLSESQPDQPISAAQLRSSEFIDRILEKNRINKTV